MCTVIFVHEDARCLSLANALSNIMEERGMESPGMVVVKESRKNVPLALVRLFSEQPTTRVDLFYVGRMPTRPIEDALVTFKDNVRSITTLGQETYEPSSMDLVRCVRRGEIALHNHANEGSTQNQLFAIFGDRELVQNHHKGN